MNNWADDVANEFKSRDNKKAIGMVIGEVLTPPPALSVSIMEGQIVVRNPYIAEHLLTGYKRRINIRLAAAEGSTNSASCSDGTHSHRLTTVGVPDTDITTLDTLKAGDSVIVYSGDNQNYFVLDRAVRPGE